MRDFSSSYHGLPPSSSSFPPIILDFDSSSLPPPHLQRRRRWRRLKKRPLKGLSSGGVRRYSGNSLNVAFLNIAPLGLVRRGRTFFFGMAGCSRTEKGKRAWRAVTLRPSSSLSSPFYLTAKVSTIFWQKKYFLKKLKTLHSRFHAIQDQIYEGEFFL